MDKLLKVYTESKNNIFQNGIWREYLESQGYKTWFIDCDKEETLVVKMPLYGQKSYFYVPHGPQTSKEGWSVFLNKMKNLARSENAVFVRIEPMKIPNGIIEELKLKRVGGFSPLSHQHSPYNTLMLDLDVTENDILAQMKPKGRYNIRLAERKGVKIRFSRDIEDLKSFYKLSLGMKERGFSSFDFDHYKKMLETLGSKGVLQIVVAEHENEILACLIILYFNEVAIYLHGASGNEKRELMPNHLAQWTAILDAKKKGCKVYDFWGIAPNDEPNHPWAGITRFKKSFGGIEIEFKGAFDFTFQPFWYRIIFPYKIVKKAFGK